jgi:O-antigen ligase
METKHIIALAAFVALGSLGIVVTLLWQKARDAALFFVVFGAALMARMDVNFLGEYWYRGTSRGIELTLVDLAAFGLLVATVLVPRYRTGRWFSPAGIWLMTLYLLYCGASVFMADRPMFGVWELTKIFRALIVFTVAALFIRTRRELAVMVVALACAVGVQFVFGVEQRILKGVHRVPGTLVHENSLSMYLCTVAPVLLAGALSDWSRWIRWLCGLAAACASVLIVMTLSRAGIPAFALMMLGTAVFCTTWRITWRKTIAALVVAAGMGVVVISSWDALAARFGSTSLREEYLREDAVETRGVYWRIVFAIADERPYGVGLNHWSYAVSKTYGPILGYLYDDYDAVTKDPDPDKVEEANHAPPAHSLAVITWGELGLPGLCLLGLLFLRWFQVGATFLRSRLNPDPMHRIGIGLLFGAGGLFLQSITEWTYRQSGILFTFHVMMGALASLYYAKRSAHAVEQEEEQPAEEPEFDALPVSVSATRLPR